MSAARLNRLSIISRPRHTRRLTAVGLIVLCFVVFAALITLEMTYYSSFKQQDLQQPTATRLGQKVSVQLEAFVYIVSTTHSPSLHNVDQQEEEEDGQVVEFEVQTHDGIVEEDDNHVIEEYTLEKLEAISLEMNETLLLEMNETLPMILNAITPLVNGTLLLTNETLPMTNATTQPPPPLIIPSHLPAPQLDFHPNRNGSLPPIQLKFQLHSCLRGRDGSKSGLRENGMPLVQKQKESLADEDLPLLYVDTHSSVILTCNNLLPVSRLVRDVKVRGKKLISTAQGLLEKLCLGSTKTRQLECRRDLATHWGCEYEALNIQPKQYILNKREECERFLAIAPSANNSTKPTSWLSKPSGGIRGRGIKYFASTERFQRQIQQIGCAHSNATGIKATIAQEYVANPALIGLKYKFDCRTWLLVASVDPLVIYYHEGFARVAKHKYNPGSRSKMVHITNAFGQQEDGGQAGANKYLRNFTEISQDLARGYGFPEDFMHNSYRRQMMRAQLFAALSQFQLEHNYIKNIQRKGYYQVFACDSMVDTFGRAHLLECNGFPAEAEQTAVTGKTIWEEMIALVMNVHVEPWHLMRYNETEQNPKFFKRGVWRDGPSALRVEQGQLKANSYVFGGWHLMFNGLETPLEEFNVCKALVDLPAAAV